MRTVDNNIPPPDSISGNAAPSKFQPPDASTARAALDDLALVPLKGAFQTPQVVFDSLHTQPAYCTAALISCKRGFF